MAGAGFDARMISDADRGLKDSLGRAAYLYTGARNLRARRVKARVTVDGAPFFRGRVSCVLVGNVGKLLGGVSAFDGARPDDGRLELGVVTARSPVEWARVLGRVALGHAGNSPFVEVTRGQRIKIRFSRELPYELDGGARRAAARLTIKARPGSITVCVPPAADA
jgi:diacylglycerol kinase (ATP)